MEVFLRIYLVEDERLVALDIRNHLINIGHEVIGVSYSGEDCLEKIDGLKPDLILMDINLEGNLTGIETATILHKTKNIPIIFLTAYTDDQTLSEIKKTGYYGYVTKPFKQIDLKTEIQFTYDRFLKLLKIKEEQDVSTQTLKQTEEFFEQVVNNVSDIIYRIDLKGFFTYVNSSAIQQTGFSREELMQMKYTNLISTEYKQKAFFFFKNIFLNKVENSYFEFPLLTKKNEEIWIGQKIHLLKYDNSIIGFQVVARDITQEKIFKEQLIIAKKNAEKTAQVKSQFLANMSHEIRTPLNGIIGLNHLLEKTELSEKQRSYIHAISRSSAQLMGIINDVLDLSKIEAGKMESIKTEFDMHDLLRSVVSILEIRANEKNLILSSEIDSDVPQFVIGDEIHLNQIMYNILGNAIKFTEKGEVKLKVSLIEDFDNKKTIQFTITDSGIGIEDEVKEKIFDAFTQAESETTRKFGGTGLGLAIVKNLVLLQGGTIDVKSKLNHGSCFTIRLKYLEAHGNSINSKVKQEDDFLQLNGLRVLMVEDNLVNQMVTKDLLVEKGVEVLVAENGQIALDILHNEQFDIILMDMQMPVMDGFQAMQSIRDSDDQQLKHIPILALTANVIQTEINKCYEFGANDYLAKPFKPDFLYSKMLNLLPSDEITTAEDVSYEDKIDWVTLKMFTNGKENLLQSTLEHLLISFKEDFVSWNTALLEKNYELLRGIAHKIKPNFLMLGMNNIGELCLEIEQTDDNDTLLEMANNLTLRLPLVLEEIQEHSLKAHSSSLSM
jgi:PAS domain S-box-containing protein